MITTRPRLVGNFVPYHVGMRKSRFLLATGPREYGNSSLTLVDDLFTGLNGGGVDAQGYADGICNLRTVADLDQGTLRRLEGFFFSKG